MAVRDFLATDQAPAVADRMGMSVADLAAWVTNLDEAPLNRLAEMAGISDAVLAGGADRIVISATTVIIVLLLILVLTRLAARRSDLPLRVVARAGRSGTLALDRTGLFNVTEPARFEGVTPEALSAVEGEAHVRATWEIFGQDGSARGTTDCREAGWKVGDFGALVALLDTDLDTMANDLATCLETFERDQ